MNIIEGLSLKEKEQILIDWIRQMDEGAMDELLTEYLDYEFEDDDDDDDDDE